MATKSTRKKSGTSSSGGGAASVLRSVVGSAGGADTILDLVERLGLVDVVLGRVKSRIEETDIDEILDDAADYLRRNPEVLVVTLGAVTVATGLLVWLNNRREWDGSERRNTGGGTTSSSPGKVRRTSASRAAANEDDDE
ncbi:MAG TPA: hypothetical protein VNM41_00350 [Solirubrobacterales bacterium]|nr:hypothetical protein [Solirubrobacterales bacterium]